MLLWLPTSLAILDFAFALSGYSSSENEEITPVGFEMRITWVERAFDVTAVWF